MLPKYRSPTHPGEMLLKEFLEPAGISQKEFSKHLGWSYARLNEIVHGHRSITVDSALSLSESLGTTPEFWLNLQQQYDLWYGMQDHKPVQKLAVNQ